MARVKANTDFDVGNAESILKILENLSRDLTHIEDRQKRLNEMGVDLEIKIDDGEVVVQLNDA